MTDDMFNAYANSGITDDDVFYVSKDGEEVVSVAGAEREDAAKTMGGTFQKEFYRDAHGNEYFYDANSGQSEEDWLLEQKQQGNELTKAGANERASNYIYSHKLYRTADGDQVFVREDEEEDFQKTAMERGWNPQEVVTKRWNGLDVTGSADALMTWKQEFSDGGVLSDDMMAALGATEEDIVRGKEYQAGLVKKIDDELKQKYGEVGFIENEATGRGLSTIGKKAEGVGDALHMYGTELADAVSLDTYWELGEMAQQLGGEDGLQKIKDMGFGGWTRAALWGGLSIEEAISMTDEQLYERLKDIKTKQLIWERIKEVRGLTTGAKIGSAAVDMAKMGIEYTTATLAAGALIAATGGVGAVGLGAAAAAGATVGGTVLAGGLYTAGHLMDATAEQTADRMYFNPATGNMEKLADGREGLEALGYATAGAAAEFAIERIGGKIAGKALGVVGKPIKKVVEKAIGKEMSAVLGLSPGIVQNWNGGGMFKQTMMKVGQAYHKMTHNAWGKTIQSGIRGCSPSGLLEEMTEEVIQAGIDGGLNIRGYVDAETGKIAGASWRAAGEGMLEVIKSAPEFAATLALYNVGAGVMSRGSNALIEAYGNKATMKNALKWSGKFTAEEVRQMTREQVRDNFKTLYMTGDAETAIRAEKKFRAEHSTADGAIAGLKKFGYDGLVLTEKDGVHTLTYTANNGDVKTVEGNEAIVDWAAQQVNYLAYKHGEMALLAAGQAYKVSKAIMFMSRKSMDEVIRQLHETGTSRAFTHLGNSVEMVDTMQQAMALQQLAEHNDYRNTPAGYFMAQQSRLMMDSIIEEGGVDAEAMTQFKKFMGGISLESEEISGVDVKPFFSAEEMRNGGKIIDGARMWEKDGIRLFKMDDGTWRARAEDDALQTFTRSFATEAEATEYVNVLAAKRAKAEGRFKMMKQQAEQMYDNLFGNKNGEARSMLVLKSPFENEAIRDRLLNDFTSKGFSHQRALKELTRINGFTMSDGTFIVFTDNAGSLTQLASTIRHEGFHAGVKNIYKLSTPEERNKFAERAVHIVGKDGGVALRDGLGQEITIEEFNNLDEKAQETVLEETLAYLCETLESKPGVSDRITDAVSELFGSAFNWGGLSSRQKAREARMIICEAFASAHDPQKAAILRSFGFDKRTARRSSGIREKKDTGRKLLTFEQRIAGLLPGTALTTEVEDFVAKEVNVQAAVADGGEGLRKQTAKNLRDTAQEKAFKENAEKRKSELEDAWKKTVNGMAVRVEQEKAYREMRQEEMQRVAEETAAAWEEHLNDKSKAKREQEDALWESHVFDPIQDDARREDASIARAKQNTMRSDDGRTPKKRFKDKHGARNARDDEQRNYELKTYEMIEAEDVNISRAVIYRQLADAEEAISKLAAEATTAVLETPWKQEMLGKILARKRFLETCVKTLEQMQQAYEITKSYWEKSKWDAADKAQAVKLIEAAKAESGWMEQEDSYSAKELKSIRKELRRKHRDVMKVPTRLDVTEKQWREGGPTKEEVEKRREKGKELTARDKKGAEAFKSTVTLDEEALAEQRAKSGKFYEDKDFLSKFSPEDRAWWDELVELNGWQDLTPSTILKHYGKEIVEAHEEAVSEQVAAEQAKKTAEEAAKAAKKEEEKKPSDEKKPEAVEQPVAQEVEKKQKAFEDVVVGKVIEDSAPKIDAVVVDSDSFVENPLKFAKDRPLQEVANTLFAMDASEAERLIDEALGKGYYAKTFKKSRHQKTSPSLAIAIALAEKASGMEFEKAEQPQPAPMVEEAATDASQPPKGAEPVEVKEPAVIENQPKSQVAVIDEDAPTEDITKERVIREFQRGRKLGLLELFRNRKGVLIRKRVNAAASILGLDSWDGEENPNVYFQKVGFFDALEAIAYKKVEEEDGSAQEMRAKEARDLAISRWKEAREQMGERINKARDEFFAIDDGDAPIKTLGALSEEETFLVLMEYYVGKEHGAGYVIPDGKTLLELSQKSELFDFQTEVKDYVAEWEAFFKESRIDNPFKEAKPAAAVLDKEGKEADLPVDTSKKENLFSVMRKVYERTMAANSLTEDSMTFNITSALRSETPEAAQEFIDGIERNLEGRAASSGRAKDEAALEAFNDEFMPSREAWVEALKNEGAAGIPGFRLEGLTEWETFALLFDINQHARLGRSDGTVLSQEEFQAIVSKSGDFGDVVESALALLDAWYDWEYSTGRTADGGSPFGIPPGHESRLGTFAEMREEDADASLGPMEEAEMSPIEAFSANVHQLEELLSKAFTGLDKSVSVLHIFGGENRLANALKKFKKRKAPGWNWIEDAGISLGTLSPKETAELLSSLSSAQRIKKRGSDTNAKRVLDAIKAKAKKVFEKFDEAQAALEADPENEALKLRADIAKDNKERAEKAVKNAEAERNRILNANAAREYENRSRGARAEELLDKLFGSKILNGLAVESKVTSFAAAKDLLLFHYEHMNQDGSTNRDRSSLSPEGAAELEQFVASLNEPGNETLKAYWDNLSTEVLALSKKTEDRIKESKRKTTEHGGYEKRVGTNGRVRYDVMKKGLGAIEVKELINEFIAAARGRDIQKAAVVDLFLAIGEAFNIAVGRSGRNGNIMTTEEYYDSAFKDASDNGLNYNADDVAFDLDKVEAALQSVFGSEEASEDVEEDQAPVTTGASWAEYKAWAEASSSQYTTNNYRYISPSLAERFDLADGGHRVEDLDFAKSLIDAYGGEGQYWKSRSIRQHILHVTGWQKFFGDGTWRHWEEDENEKQFIRRFDELLGLTETRDRLLDKFDWLRRSYEAALQESSSTEEAIAAGEIYTNASNDVVRKFASATVRAYKSYLKTHAKGLSLFDFVDEKTKRALPDLENIKVVVYKDLSPGSDYGAFDSSTNTITLNASKLDADTFAHEAAHTFDSLDPETAMSKREGTRQDLITGIRKVVAAAPGKFPRLERWLMSHGKDNKHRMYSNTPYEIVARVAARVALSNAIKDRAGTLIEDATRIKPKGVIPHGSDYALNFFGPQSGGGLNYKLSNIFTGSAADYAQRIEDGEIVNPPSLRYVGSGEGSQVYGWGLYGSLDRGVAEWYAKKDVDKKRFSQNGFRWRGFAFMPHYAFDGKRTVEIQQGIPEADRFALEALFEETFSVPKAKQRLEKLAEDFLDSIEYKRSKRDSVKDRNPEVASLLDADIEGLIKSRAEISEAINILSRESESSLQPTPGPGGPDPARIIYEQTFFTNREDGDWSHLLDWDGEVTKEQAKWINAQVESEGVGIRAIAGDPGDIYYQELAKKLGSPKAASEFLARAGIDGVTYIGVSSGERNLVSFRDDNIRVDHKWVDGRIVYKIMADEGKPMNEGVDRAYRERISGRAAMLEAWGNKVYDKLINEQGALFRGFRKVVGDRDVEDDLNVEAAAKNMHGKVRVKVDNIRDKYIKPLYDIIKENKLDVDRLNEYLYAKFAPERNAMIKARTAVVNPETGELETIVDDGSGMSDAKAKQLMHRFDLDPKRDAYNRAMHLVWQMNAASSKMMLDYGFVTQGQIDQWAKLSPHYVPLKDIETKKFTMRRAAGRKTEADNPLAASIHQANAIIRAGEASNVNKVVARFVEKYDPDGKVMGGKVLNYSGDRKGVFKSAPMFVPNNSEAERELRDLGVALVETDESKELDGKFVAVDNKVPIPNELRVRIMRSKSPAPNAATFWENGTRRFVVFDKHNQEALNIADALNHAKLQRPDKDSAFAGLWDLSQRLVRFKADVSTTLNPRFILRNAWADFFNTSLVLATEGKWKQLGGFAKHYLGAIKTVRALAKGKDISKTKLGKYYLEAREQGMLTGVYGEGTFKDAAHKLERDVKRLKGGNVRAAWEGFKEFMETVGSYPEQGARLAVYAAMRDNGMSPAKAAQYGREVTVDFNAKGQVTPWVNSLYMFSNAGAQGIYRAIKAVKTGAEARGGGAQGYVRALLPGVSAAMIMGFVSAMLMDMMGGDDDDEGVGSARDRLPKHVKDSALAVPLGDGKYLQLPTRGMWQPFTRLGGLVYDFGKGTASGSEVALGFTDAIRDSVDFIGGSAPTFAQWASPTVIDPLIQILEGKDWTGKDLYLQDFGQKQAQAHRSKSGTGSLYKMVAQGLNSITGGDKVRGGLVDVHPETLQLISEFFLGSLMTMGDDAWQTVEALAGGEDDYNVKHTPFVGGVLREVGGIEQQYYGAYKEFNDISKTYDAYLKQAKSSHNIGERQSIKLEADKMLKQHPWLRSAKGLRKMSKSIQELNSKIQNASSKEQRDALKKALKDKERYFVKTVTKR